MSSAAELKLLVDAIERSLVKLRSELPAFVQESQAKPSSDSPTVDQHQTALASLKETVDELDQHTTSLRDKLKPRKGIKWLLSEIKDLTTFIFSLTALVLSFVSLLFTYVWLAPDIRLIKGESIVVGWVPADKKLQLDFPITVANYGRRMDVVKWMQGQLGPLSGTSRPISFSTRKGDFTLTPPTKTELSLPFTVPEKSAMDAKASVSEELGTETHDSFFRKPNQQEGIQYLELKIQLNTASGTNVSTEFCFDIPDKVLADIENGTAKELPITECRGGR